MKDIHLHSVDVIEGIGPQLRSAFEQQGVHSLVDLIRIPFPALHKMVATKASLDQIESWANMARLLLVGDMDAQTAEALVKSKVQTLQGLYFTQSQRLTQILLDAKAQGLIPEVPDPQTITNIRTDAAALYFSGSVFG